MALNPNIALAYGFKAIFTFEARGVYLNWHNINDYPNGSKQDVSMQGVLVMFLLQICVFLLFSAFWETIIHKIVFSCKTHLFNCKNRLAEDCKDTTKLQSAMEIEKEVVVNICNLTKKIGSLKILDNFDMNLYENHVTVLLGENGAGKTSLLSVLSGKF